MLKQVQHDIQPPNLPKSGYKGNMKKVALITGGARGIGYGIAKSLAKDGFDLAINDIVDPKNVVDNLNELKQSGAKTLYCRGDISRSEDRDAVVSHVRQFFGALNVLVNNAGVAPKERKDILETSEESFEYVLRINLYGSFFLSQKTARWMIEQKKANPNFEGCLINISSVSATVASVNRGEYCISKAGLSMVTKLFAVRLGEYGIPVYEICPGVIKTDMTAGVTEKYDRLIEQGLMVQKRWGYPEDIGKAVSALAAGSFPYSTGQVIMVDGGMTLQRL